ncbi:MAG: colicin E3/pyocin S6 family cytotoxin [Roseiarcus sp.]
MPVPIPKPCILDGYERIPGRKRWRNDDGARLFEWDGLHGEVEVYNARGWHLGVMHPVTGEWIKPAVKGRRIDV